MVPVTVTDRRMHQATVRESSLIWPGSSPAGTNVPYAALDHIRVASGDDYAPTARELFGRVSIRFREGLCPSANLTSADLGPCRLSQIDASAHHVRGEKVVEHSYDSDSIKIILQIDGHSLFEQAGLQIALKPSAWVAYDPTQAYSLANTTSVQQLMLQVPRHAVATRTLNCLALPRWTSDHGAGIPAGLIAAMMRATLVEVRQFNAATRTRVGETLLHLSLGLIEHGPTDEPDRTTSLDILRQRVQTYLAAHLELPSVDINEVAKRMGCSRRYIFRAFEAENTTPSRYLWELRLTRSRDLLAAPSKVKRTISDVGFACGFSSSAHFSRAFRARFGCSPSAYRIDSTAG